MSDRLQKLYTEQGQSAWLDNLRRDYITSGKLVDIRDSGARGLTSNPSIFQKAIQGSADYDEQFQALIADNDGGTGDVIEDYWSLVIRDIHGACDVAVIGRPSQLARRLDFLPLLESPLQFCMPAADCSVRETVCNATQSAGDIDWSGIPFIVPERGTTKEMLDNWMQARDIRPRIYAQVAGHEAIVAMVSLGLGVGIAPQLVIEASGMAERVDTVAVEDGLPPLVIGLCSLGQRLQSPLVKSLWEVAQQTYATRI